MHRREILELVRNSGREGLTLAALMRTIAQGSPIKLDEADVASLLEELESRGEVVRGKGRLSRIVAIELTDCYAGNLRRTARGFGIVRSVERDFEDIVIPPEKLAGALDGDLVLAKREKRRQRGQIVAERYGEVVRVLRRKHPTLVGRFFGDAKKAWVEPIARKLGLRVQLKPRNSEMPRSGEFVEVSIDGETDSGVVEGQLVRRIGMSGESGVDEDAVLIEAGVPMEFSLAALEQAVRLPPVVGAEDCAGRIDYRDQPAVTIDGETARDFDDAVVAFATSGGGIEVFVHIADVSHYVGPKSPLDLDARERGTSVYLPARCVPMFPEKLSSQLCSLLAEQDRLVFTVRFVVNPDGGVEGYHAFRGVFRSRRRCTYTEVFNWLDSGCWPVDLADGVRDSLILLDQAAERLGKRRRQRGSIDFDLPEPEILLDPEGFMTGVRAGERNRAHRLIEELMVTANDCVARMLTWGRQLGLFRVHEPPSPGKLAELDAVLAEFGVGLKGDLEHLPPRELQKILGEIAGRPEERFLQALILRSLARAVYHKDCKGHYALATDFYLHFTSPIRRYPDLVVHRFLAEMLAGKVRQGTERKLAEWDLEELATHCSFTERRAAEAEREVVKWKQIEFMRLRIGEVFSGHISGVVAFGVFVQLTEIFVEGLVRMNDLGDDFYRYDEVGHRLVGQRHGRVLRLGDALFVRVLAINDELKEINLQPILPQLAEGERANMIDRQSDRPEPKPKPHKPSVRKTSARGPRRGRRR